ncbi:MAG: hypothetical protein LBU95_03210 [Rikenellaceae bacterium]|nr:hypothetical protein [Rikenellaceae bacterium]
MIKDRFAAIESPLIVIPDYITQRAALVKPSITINDAMWLIDVGIVYGNVNGDESLSFDEAVAKMKTVYTARLARMKAYINGGCTAWP